MQEYIGIGKTVFVVKHRKSKPQHKEDLVIASCIPAKVVSFDENTICYVSAKGKVGFCMPLFAFPSMKSAINAVAADASLVKKKAGIKEEKGFKE